MIFWSPRVLLSNLNAFSMQHLWWLKNNIFDRLEILVQKADLRWHGSDKAGKLNTCGLILGCRMEMSDLVQEF